MRILIFDTETTGLPSVRKPASHGPNNWPHIVSISWIVLESSTNQILKKEYRVVKPMFWTIPNDSVKIHGITQEKAVAEGHELKTVMAEFLSETCDIVLAHNLEFDFNVVLNAMRWDLGDLSFSSIRGKMFCTMTIGKYICKLPSQYGKGYKPPKLKEFYKHVFGKDPNESQLHNSLYDTCVLTEIVQKCIPLRQAIGISQNEANAIQAPRGGTLHISLE